MALVKPGILFQKAYQEGYALGAFNVFNLESVQAVLRAAQMERSAVIVQVSMGARKYVGDLDIFLRLLKMMAEPLEVPVCIHHDHCTDFEICKQSIDAGFSSIMIDGSKLTFKENIRLVRKVADYAHEKGVWVEAELGSLPGFEDDFFSEDNQYTNPDDVGEFVRESTCDSLAVAVGTSHGGVKADQDLKIDMERLQKISNNLPGFPLVLHGGASITSSYIDTINHYGGKVEYMKNVPEPLIRETVKLGVCKVNMDVDNFNAYTAAIRRYMTENPAIYDPRKYTAVGRDAFMNEVRHKMSEVILSSGRYKASDYAKDLGKSIRTVDHD
ncbi:MAG TPA: fructose-bisphosphate aldolase [Firmicutes bacterium]|jgi:fructose-bisphosphate aldolase, class II|nr:fructose-bisphosphate aldolase [Bacillota bacterium]